MYGPWFNPDRWFINPLPFNREYNRDPMLKAHKKEGAFNHGSTLGFRIQEVWLKILC